MADAMLIHGVVDFNAEKVAEIYKFSRFIVTVIKTMFFHDMLKQAIVRVYLGSPTSYHDHNTVAHSNHPLRWCLGTYNCDSRLRREFLISTDISQSTFIRNQASCHKNTFFDSCQQQSDTQWTSPYSRHC